MSTPTHDARTTLLVDSTTRSSTTPTRSLPAPLQRHPLHSGFQALPLHPVKISQNRRGLHPRRQGQRQRTFRLSGQPQLTLRLSSHPQLLRHARQGPSAPRMSRSTCTSAIRSARNARWVDANTSTASTLRRHLRRLPRRRRRRRWPSLMRYAPRYRRPKLSSPAADLHQTLDPMRARVKLSWGGSDTSVADE